MASCQEDKIPTILEVDATPVSEAPKAEEVDVCFTICIQSD